jgi:hypothetical protein
MIYVALSSGGQIAAKSAPLKTKDLLPTKGPQHYNRFMPKRSLALVDLRLLRIPAHGLYFVADQRVIW